MSAAPAIPDSWALIPGYGWVDEDGVFKALDGPVFREEFASDSLPGGLVEVDEDSADWALGKLFVLDGEIVATKARLDAELSAVKRNWEPRLNTLRRARESFLSYVEPGLEAFAKKFLAEINTKSDGTPVSKPARSVARPRGRLQFRAVNEVSVAQPEGGVAVTASAIEWLLKTYPAAVELVPKINLDGLSKEDRDEIRAVVAGEKTVEEAEWPGPCPLKVTLPGESFSVETGVK